MLLKKKNLGFSIWIYVFGFSRCNGLIKINTFVTWSAKTNDKPKAKMG